MLNRNIPGLFMALMTALCAGCERSAVQQNAGAVPAPPAPAAATAIAPDEAIATTSDAREELSSLSVQELTARLAEVAVARRAARRTGDAARDGALAREFQTLLQEIRSRRWAGEPATPARAGDAGAHDQHVVPDETAEAIAAMSRDELRERVAVVASARRAAAVDGDTERGAELTAEFRMLLDEMRRRGAGSKRAAPPASDPVTARDVHITDETAEALAAMSREELAAKLPEVAAARWAAHEAGDEEREEALVAEFQALVQEIRSRGAADGDSGQVRLSFSDVALWDMYVFLLQESGKKVSVGEQALRHRTTIESQFIPREEALELILDKLRADGLLVDETDQEIVIRLDEDDVLHQWPTDGKP